MNNNYQSELTERRRAAYWRALRSSNEWQRQGKRDDQVAFSATVVFAILALTLLAGVACGCWAAVERIGGGL